MKIKFVGTGSGKTSLNQFHSSLLISNRGYNLLIDAGDGISRALLSHNIDFNSINGIIFTHLHPDHFSGFTGLIVQMKMTNRTRSIDIFVHKSLKNIVEDFLLHSYLLPERLKFKLRYKTFTESTPVNIANDFSFIARGNQHLSKLQKYKKNYPSISLFNASLCLKAGGKKIIYTSDIGSAKDLYVFSDQLSEIFISEANHIEPSELFNALRKIKTKKIVLTHYSESDFIKLSEILATLNSKEKLKIIFAKDGIFFEI